MCERSIAVEHVETRFFVVKARFPYLGCRIVTNSCTCVSLIHFTKLLNEKLKEVRRVYLSFFFGKISI